MREAETAVLGGWMGEYYALSESPWKRMLVNTVIQSTSLRENSAFLS